MLITRLIRSVSLSAFLLFAPMVRSSVVITPIDTAVTSLTRKAVYDIFTLKNRMWSDGIPITVVTLPPAHPASVDFVISVIRYPSVGQFFTAIEAATARSKNVFYAANEAQVIEYVTTHKGAIGYVDQKLVLHEDRVAQLRVTP